MNYKTSLLILSIALTLSTCIQFAACGWICGVISAVTTILSWGFFLMPNKNLTVIDTIEEQDISPKHKKEKKSEIPGYRESEENMAACFNCNYSKDIDNRTFVECKQYQKKVYRRNICDTHKN